MRIHPRYRYRLAIALAAGLALAVSPQASGLSVNQEPDSDVTAADEDCPLPPTRDLNVTTTVYRVGDGLNVSDKVMLAGFEAGWVESKMHNVPCGDADSVGVFQQRPSQGWGTVEQIMNVEYAATQFFTRAKNVEAVHPTWRADQIAQEVQNSGFPDRYGEAESIARTLLAEAAALVRPVLVGGVEGSSVVVSDGRVWVFGRSDVNGDVYGSFWNGQDFTAWDSLAPGDFLGRPSAIEYEGKVHVFARGLNGALYQQVRSDGQWLEDWKKLDGQLSGDPQAVVYGNSIQVYAPGFDTQGQPGPVYQKAFNPNTRTWNDWAALPGGGQFTGRPSVVAFNGDLHVFGRGLNDAVYEQVFTRGGTWRKEGWFPHSGKLSADPQAVVYGDSIQVYGAGFTPEGQPGPVYQKAFNPNTRTWNDWIAVPGGGQFTGRPSTIVFGRDLHVFARGANNALYEQVWTPGTGWRKEGWFAHAGTLSSDPTSIVFNSSLQAYAIGTDTNTIPGATFHQRAWNGTTWLPWRALPPGDLTE